jgi:hypothetical protein
MQFKREAIQEAKRRNFTSTLRMNTGLSTQISLYDEAVNKHISIGKIHTFKEIDEVDSLDSELYDSSELKSDEFQSKLSESDESEEEPNNEFMTPPTKSKI